jgi:phenylpropionate dioxygenase-like ring-hydroxylating dioxygenase large terminal subunit
MPSSVIRVALMHGGQVRVTVGDAFPGYASRVGDVSDWDDLVQPDRVHRSVYTDPRIFELEMDRIFGRAWILVGHDSQIPAPGDYVTAIIGRQPVIMARHRDGAVHVLFNRCAHKGAELEVERSGHVESFRCPYHGWRFATDGAVLTIPLERGYEGSGFGRCDPLANMQHVPRADSYRGFVFASLSPTGPGLVEWLGGVASSIDNMVDRSPEGALEATGGVLRYEHNCNWKFFVENLNDMMHPMVAHLSSSQTARGVARRELGEAAAPAAIEILAPFTNQYAFFDAMGLRAFDHGHGYSGGTISIHSAYSDIPEYQSLMETAYGAERTRAILAVERHNTVIYPSATIKGKIQTMRVVRPVAVDRTIIESYVFRLKGAPEALLHRSILYSNLINSSANLVGPDDHAIYKRLQRGLATSGSDWVSLHRNADADAPEPDGGWSSGGTSDMAFRRQFAAWKQMMAGATQAAA